MRRVGLLAARITTALYLARAVAARRGVEVVCVLREWARGVRAG